MESYRAGKVLGSTILVAGTCMGGAMLGMPIVNGLGGIFPTFVLTTVIWLSMLATAYLLVEATIALPDGANYLSLSERYFGKWGKVVIGTFYFFFYFCVTVSYPATAIPLLSEFLAQYSLPSIGPEWLYLLFGSLFGFFAFAGARSSDRFNFFLMIFFFLFYLLLVVKAGPYIRVYRILRMNWIFMFLSAPILFSAFSFHCLIPTLVTYLRREIRLLKRSIFWGMCISYICYLVWQITIIGTIPKGALWEAFERGDILVEGMRLMAKTPWLGAPALGFGFLALATAMIGMSLSFIDFIADGLKWPPQKRVKAPRALLTSLLFGCVIFFAYFFPQFFFDILGYAGGIGFAILSGIVPIAMAWRARYHHNYPLTFLVPGGRATLLLLFIVTLYIVYLQGIMIIH